MQFVFRLTKFKNILNTKKTCSVLRYVKQLNLIVYYWRMHIYIVQDIIICYSTVIQPLTTFVFLFLSF
jgi:hypothetical protein